MYRAVAWSALQRGINLDDAAALAELVGSLQLELDGKAVRLDGQDVSTEIRSHEVTEAVRHVADNPEVRSHLSQLQRVLAGSGNIVTEGRDQGTVVFPNADIKFYLTASAEERARRRSEQLRRQGHEVSTDEILLQQNQRDQHDSNRPVGSLKKADDAIEVSTTGLSVDEVLDRLESIALQK
jgi:cytidylate kinase